MNLSISWPYKDARILEENLIEYECFAILK